MHGLGLGLTQYRRYIEHMLVALPDHPILVPLLPHVSQEILHPRFLRPMDRKEMSECLASLIASLGWADVDEMPPDVPASDSDETSPAAQMQGEGVVTVPKGVTMVSHSKSVQLTSIPSTASSPYIA